MTAYMGHEELVSQTANLQGGGVDASGWNVNFGSGSASSSSSSSGSGLLGGLGIGINDVLLIALVYLLARGKL